MRPDTVSDHKPVLFRATKRTVDPSRNRRDAFLGPERLPILHVGLPNHPIRIRAIIVVPEKLRCVCPGFDPPALAFYCTDAGAYGYQTYIFCQPQNCGEISHERIATHSPRTIALCVYERVRRFYVGFQHRPDPDSAECSCLAQL